jgi:hypothetical protein
MEQLNMVGPRSLGVCLLTAAFVGMVFTIQFIRWVEGITRQALYNHQGTCEFRHALDFCAGRVFPAEAAFPWGLPGFIVC